MLFFDQSQFLLPTLKPNTANGIIWGLNYAYDIYREEVEEPVGIFLELIPTCERTGYKDKAMAYAAAMSLWELLGFSPNEGIYFDEHENFYGGSEEKGHFNFPKHKECPPRANIHYHELFTNEEQFFERRWSSLTMRGMHNPLEYMQLKDLIVLDCKKYVKPVADYIKKIHLFLEAKLYRRK